jgi:hypothetical protein
VIFTQTTPTNVDTSICEGDFYYISGSSGLIYDATGIYVDTLYGFGFNGCDSVVITNLTVIPNDTIYTQSTTCNSSLAGTFTNSYVNVNGCDSTVINTVIFLQSDTTYLTATSCDQAQAGQTSSLLTNNNGCDSLVITTTSFLPSIITTIDTSICQGEYYAVYNPALPTPVGYNQTGIYMDTLTGSNGCDSIVISNLTVNSLDTTYLIAASCDQTQVGVSQILMTNMNGCDSLVITTTSLLASDTTILLFTTCDTAQAGTITQILTNINGCDSTVISITQMLSTQITYLNAITCDISMVGVVIDTFSAFNGCDSLIITTTTLSSLPTITVSNDMTICNGESVPLSSSGGATYSWSPSVGLSNPNIANPIATPTVTTTYVLTIANNNGCTATDSVTITVNPTPVLSLPSNVTICNGDTIQVVVSGIGTYSWLSAPGISNTTIANPFFFPISTTIYTLTLTNSVGCSVTDSVIVTVENPPVITVSPDVAICESKFTTLNATGGVLYSWSPSVGLNNPTIPNPIASPTVTTTYNVAVSSTLGCTAYGSVTVTVNDTITPYIIQNGNILTAFPTGGMGYTWFYADTFFTAGNGFLVTNVGSNPLSIDSAGYYRVRVTDANGCTFESETVFIDVVATRQPISTIQNLMIMPNPTRDYVDIRFDNIKSQSVEIVLYNKTGQRIYEKVIDVVVGNHSERLDLMDIPAGVYIVRIAGEDFVINRQLLIIGN